MKILGSKLILSKKPSGPSKETMVASLVEVGLVGPDKKNPTYVIQYVRAPFNINKALRASPEEIKKLSKEQINARVKKYVLGNLGMQSRARTFHSSHSSLTKAKATIKSLLNRFKLA